MPKSDYWENKLLNKIFNAAALTFPTTVYVGLYTSAPNDTGGGTEVSGGSYLRKAVTLDATNFPVTTTGVIANAIEIAFAQATNTWGTIVAAGLFDAQTAGNLLYYKIGLSKPVDTGDTIRIPIGSLTITED